MQWDGYVLAGGASRRMGRDKAGIAVDGVAMAVRVAEALRPHCASVHLVRKDPTGPVELGLPVLADVDGRRHPLVGVLTGLRRSEAAVFAPCDVPYLTSVAVASLIAAAPSVAVDPHGRLHPLLLAIPGHEADRIEAAVAAGASARATVGDLAHVTLPFDVLRNLNAPGDLDA